MNDEGALAGAPGVGPAKSTDAESTSLVVAIAEPTEIVTMPDLIIVDGRRVFSFAHGGAA
jgi:hypothetical protein